MVTNIPLNALHLLNDLPPPGPYKPTRSVLDRLTAPLRFIFGWVAIAGILISGMLFAILTLGYRRERYFHKLAMACCQAVLWFQGVDVRFVGFEQINNRTPRIVALNHISQLDMFAAAAFLPPGGTPIAKKEILLIPFIGQFFWIFNVIMIDRKNRERARASLIEAGQRILNERTSIYIAPEGTRSINGKLKPFKMGIFHLAEAAKVPIVPIVLRGAAECMPKGKIVALPGVVEIRVCAAVPTTDYTQDNIKEKRLELEAIFAAALNEPPPVHD